MNLMKIRIIFLLLMLIFLPCHKGYSQEDKSLYYKGVKAANKGELDFAFMYFHLLLNGFPESEYYAGSLFAVGEYYFLINDYSNATQIFNRFISDFPESKVKPFAIAYLIEIVKKTRKVNIAEEFKKELLSSQHLSLLFRDFEELQYSSALSKNYKALYFIDRIEIFIDDELFTKIPF